MIGGKTEAGQSVNRSCGCSGEVYADACTITITKSSKWNVHMSSVIIFDPQNISGLEKFMSAGENKGLKSMQTKRTSTETRVLPCARYI
jgi:hypothetical protein